MDDDMEYIVYMATNTVNGKRYIGATNNFPKRRRKHFTDARSKIPGCRIFNAAIRKYGEEAFFWEIISLCQSHAAVMDEEVRLIALHCPEYNIASGGRGVIGVPRTDEWRKKVSDALRGRKPSDRAIQRSIENNAARATVTVVCLNDGYYGKIEDVAAHFGVPSKTIRSISNKDKKAGAHHGGLFFVRSDTPIGLDWREIELSRLQAASKLNKMAVGWSKRRPVRRLPDNKEFPSVAAAARASGITNMRVVQICQSGGATGNGLSFQYRDKAA